MEKGTEKLMNWVSVTHRAVIQYKYVDLPVQETPLWRQDGRKIVLSPQWDFLYWKNGTCILKQPPAHLSIGTQQYTPEKSHSMAKMRQVSCIMLQRI